ncbi:MAG: DNA polymerase III subunit delta [Bacteroidales bacterium]|jgi:DNA polymerase-3 subunit delta|nr:DNA polymerase III subunit delta [Bacteroidales bacterium]
MAATFENIMADMKKGNFRPVYFLAGEEPYYIDVISDYIEQHALAEADKAFNQTVIYGDSATVSLVADSARRYPMMANRQVIIVKEAQNLKKIEELAAYFSKPTVSTVLVFCYKYKTPDKRTSFFKTLDANAVYFESAKLYDNQVPAWVERYLMEKGARIEPSANAMLAEYLGTDLHKIANELDKLIIALPDRKLIITGALVEKYIGISKDYNTFELQKAIGERNVVKANTIAFYFAGNPKAGPFNLIIASLLSFFSKLLAYHYLGDKSKANVASALKIRPFFVRDYETAAARYSAGKTVNVISLLRTYDLKSKGFDDAGTDPGELLKEMVYKILH